IEELDELLPHLENGAQVVIGSRRLPGAAIELRQPRLRQMMGSVFTMLTRALVVGVTDATCGFKLFSHDAARAIFSRLTLDDWSFDAEVLFLAHRLGFTVAEVPVRWRDVAVSWRSRAPTRVGCRSGRRPSTPSSSSTRSSTSRTSSRSWPRSAVS